MFKYINYHIFIIFGIILFILLNNIDYFSVGGKNIDESCENSLSCNDGLGNCGVRGCICDEGICIISDPVEFLRDRHACSTLMTTPEIDTLFEKGFMFIGHILNNFMYDNRSIQLKINEYKLYLQNFMVFFNNIKFFKNLPYNIQHELVQLFNSTDIQKLFSNYPIMYGLKNIHIQDTNIDIMLNFLDRLKNIENRMLPSISTLPLDNKEHYMYTIIFINPIEIHNDEQYHFFIIIKDIREGDNYNSKIYTIGFNRYSIDGSFYNLDIGLTNISAYTSPDILTSFYGTYDMIESYQDELSVYVSFFDKGYPIRQNKLNYYLENKSRSIKQLNEWETITDNQLIFLQSLKDLMLNDNSLPSHQAQFRSFKGKDTKLLEFASTDIELWDIEEDLHCGLCSEDGSGCCLDGAHLFLLPNLLDYIV